MRMAEFSLSLEDPKLIKSVVESIESLVEEASIKVDPEEGFAVRALETAKTALVQVLLPREVFSKFEVPERRFFGVNFTELARLLKRAKPSDVVHLEIEGTTMAVRLVGDYTRRFTMRLYGGEEFELRPLNVNFTAGARIVSSEFPRIVQDLKVKGSEVTLSIDRESVRFSAGAEGGEGEISLPRDSPVVLDIWVDEPARSMYSLAFLEKMVKPAAISDELSIQLASDKPLKLFYALPGFSKAGVTYYLANLSL